MVAKKHWDEIVEKKAALILESSGLAKHLQEKVTGFVLSIGMRMLTWAEYHEGTFGFSREYSIKFLNSSFFTPQGIIDIKTAAEELMKDKSLSIKQRYKLSCIYCFTENVPALYRQMIKKDKKEFYDAERHKNIKQPELVKFWSYYIMGDADKLKGEKPLYKYRIEKAIESGSKMAVGYCLKNTNLSRKEDILVDAALEAIRNKITSDDYIVFRNKRYDDSDELWVPSDYYLDILCFLFSKMRVDQRIEFLKKDIEGFKYEREPFENSRRSRVLEYFLNWPYQDYFMDTAKLMWQFLPEKNFAVLLLKICDKIESKVGTFLYGEDKSYDYRELLRKFWCRSPEHYKRYVLSDQEVIYRMLEVKAGITLLIKLVTLKKSTFEDEKDIGLILASATDKERENFCSSEEWRDIIIELIQEEKWEILNSFVVNFFSSKEEADKFKSELSFTKEVQNICIGFVKNDKLNAAELFIKWSSLSEEKIIQLHKEMIYSYDGNQACMDLFSYDDLEIVNKFCKWFFSSEDEVRNFKKEFIYSDRLVGICTALVMINKFEFVDKFASWCLSSEEGVREYKKHLAYTNGNHVCEEFLSDYSEENIYNEQGCAIDFAVKFKGGKWEEVEKFLTWCFSSEKEISDLKKYMASQTYDIHFNLVRCNQWEEAETFFAWLGLSAEEIKEFKKDTLYKHSDSIEWFSDLMTSEEGDQCFAYYGSKQEAIELLLRWYLTDKKEILEFKNAFKCWHRGELTEELKAFDLMIEKYLNDLDEEQSEK